MPRINEAAKNIVMLEAGPALIVEDEHLLLSDLKEALAKIKTARLAEIKAEQEASDEVLKFGQNGSFAFGLFESAKHDRTLAEAALYTLLKVPNPPFE